jgi:hypothetical protein
MPWVGTLPKWGERANRRRQDLRVAADLGTVPAAALTGSHGVPRADRALESTLQTPGAPRSDSHSTPSSSSRWLGPLVWLAVFGSLGWFFVLMVQLEPLTGDGWYNADEVKNGVTFGHIVDQLVYLHHNGNPRSGMIFTMLTYGSQPFHTWVTPAVLLLLLWLVAVHALGRWPSVRSAHDGLLVLAGTACCFLAVPQPGHAWFYRPITTNYLYTMALALAFFLPQRLGLRIKSIALAALFGAFLFALGLVVGKGNEHTGPTMIVVAAVYTALALRDGARTDLVWRAAALLGVLVGYLYLFFAPGQQVRYGSLGRQSVLETITSRGVMGTADLLGEYAGYIGPLLLAMCVLGLFALLVEPGAELLERLARAKWTILAYVGLSMLLLGTSLAAPKNHYRLFIAPAVMLAIAAVAVLGAIARSKWSAGVLGASSALIVASMVAIFVPMFAEIHADELARNEIVRAADPTRTVIIPRTRYAKRNPYYYGDSLTADPRHRARMASLFGVHEIRMVPKPPDAKKKAAKKPKKKAVDTVDPLDPLDPLEEEES